MQIKLIIVHVFLFILFLFTMRLELVNFICKHQFDLNSCSDEMSRIVEFISKFILKKGTMNDLGPKIPVITRISSNLIRILGCNPGPMTLQGTNTYLLGSGTKRILVDTGDPDVPKYINSLKSVLEEEKAAIETVILTHWHHDHVGGVKDIVKSLKQKCHVWKYPRTDALDFCPEIPSDISVNTMRNGQIFSVDGATIKAIHTPGHTTDHVILSMDDGALFSGDCILGEGTAVFEDLYDYMKSLNKILDMKPLVIYPGHGNIIKEPITKIQYYINHRNEREKQIIEVFQSNETKEFDEMDVVKIVYKDTPEALWPAAAYNVNHHLKKLVKEGILVEREIDGKFLWRFAKKMPAL